MTDARGERQLIFSSMLSFKRSHRVEKGICIAHRDGRVSRNGNEATQESLAMDITIAGLSLSLGKVYKSFTYCTPLLPSTG